ncbi:BTB/POZ domain-containing protein KCTD21-like isoform X1 [Asterias amurensis]|uniref:BTB/POZ domain-containing protein KCTD21-like isoform X1 n=2 Tax=Asterias amurensis TaxID=7602 RepID=UPI003AB676D8
MQDFVTLKVGGCLYQTTLTTLRNRPDTMLAKMFSSRFLLKKDDEGNFLLDGDGPTFRHILNFLRRSCLCLPETFDEWDLLKTEADFFHIHDLIDAADILFEEREERKKRKAEETQFIQIVSKRATSDGHLITGYIGSFNLLKEIDPLWEYFQQFYYDEYTDLSVEHSIEEILEHSQEKELTDGGISSVENFKSLDPLATCQTITQYGFALINTTTLAPTKTHYDIQKYLFGRTVKK